MSLFYETDSAPGVQYLELSALDVGFGVQYLYRSMRRMVEQDLQRATTYV